MRIKRAPLRASGMEGTSCIPKSEVPDGTVSANVKTEKSTHYHSHSQQGRSVGSKKGRVNHMDDETEVAKAKLRHQELLGHIKVEMDEVGGGAPTVGPHAQGGWSARHCIPPCVAGLCRHCVGPLSLSGRGHASGPKARSLSFFLYNIIRIFWCTTAGWSLCLVTASYSAHLRWLLRG